ncbi:hypothetical protein FQN54_008099 [Arachnomyces sp. PD_36]|nr:hypothetical protein FQN54_008099 [Arachnomyces sp. PD_36]
MENQQFYNPNSNNPAPRFRTKPTQTPDGSEACEEPHAKKAASPAENTHLHNSVHVETPEFPSTEDHHAENYCSSDHSPVGNASDNDSGSEDDLRNTPIVIDDESIVNTFPECEEERQSHDEEMPLSIASLGHSGGGAGSCDEVNSGTAKHSPSGKRKRDSESEISSSNAEGPRLLAVFSGHDGSDQTQPPGSETYRSADHHSDETQSDVVWEYHGLRGYKIVDGKPFVLVPWLPTWEPAAEFSAEEVERVKRRCELRKSRRPGRPPLKRVWYTQERATRG